MPGPSLTLIQDTLRDARGNPASGSLLISWSAGVSPEGSTISAGRMQVLLLNGAISLSLVPGEYQVGFQTTGVTKTETWVVPAGPGPFTIAQIQQ